MISNEVLNTFMSLKKNGKHEQTNKQKKNTSAKKINDVYAFSTGRK